MYKKVIIQGRLVFAKSSFDKVITMYETRETNYYRGDVLFKPEEIFQHERNMILIPRHVGQTTEKTFRNTTALVAYCAQFALDGTVKAWLLDEGRILHAEVIEPDSDKVAVRQYLKGKSLVKQKGRHKEAITALNKAIEKYDRHAQAYERRGKVNLLMNKYHDAIRDYDKSLSIDDTNPHAFYGRAKVNLINENYEDAISDLEHVLKYSVALQPIYWKARRLKAETHLKLKQHDKAAFDLKFFAARKFKDDDPNNRWKKWAFFNYGVLLLEKEDFDGALKAFEEAANIENGLGDIEISSILRNRGIAKKKAGKNGYIKDIKEAAALGDADAKTLLQEMA